MKRILVPTDFSATATNAYRYAVEMAEVMNAEIVLLHAIDIPITEGNLPFQEHTNQNELVFLMELSKKRFAETLKAVPSNVKTATALQFNGFLEGVGIGVDKHNIDLIVMGTTGSSGWQEGLIGSNTAKMIRWSKVPVLSIPHGASFKGISSAVIVSDFKTEDTNAYENVINLIQDFDPIYHLLNVITPTRFESSGDSLKRMRDFGEKSGIPYSECVPYADYTVLQGVVDFHEQVPCALTIMGTQGRKGISHFFNPSETEHVASHYQFPLLTFHL